jgi:hypothetical protein
MAKLALRSVSFACSLIVLSMISATLRIFFVTKELPVQSSLPPWAVGTSAWPQIACLSAACINLAICCLIFIGYCRGGHRRAEKVGVYYTLFAVGWFIFSMIMWCAAAGILQFTKNNSNNKDLWGWSCVNNLREQEFSKKIDYALVCRLQVSMKDVVHRPTAWRLTLSRTGAWYVPSSRSYSRPSASPSTPSSSTATGPSGSS